MHRRPWIPALMVLAATIFVHAQAPSCTPIPPGAAFWWPGENSTDDVLGGNPGTLQGSVALTASGKVGGAFDFSDGILRVYSRPGLEAQTLSIEAWVNARSTGNYNDAVGPVIVSKDRGNFSPSISYSLAGPSNVGRFRASVGLTDGTDPAVVSTNAFAFNAFHHVVSTWDGYDLRLYVNGALEGELNVEPHNGQNGPKTVVYGGHDVGIGRHPLFGGRNFDGVIDEPTFYTRALGPTEVLALFAAGSAGKCKPQPACTPAPGGVSHWWRAEGTTDDSAGAAIALLEGQAGYAAGFVGTAFDFDNGVLRAPSDSGLEPSTLSIEAWIYARSTGAYNDSIGPIVVSKDRGSVSPSISYSLAGPSNSGRFRASVGLADGTDPSVSSTNAFVFNAFHHLVMTWDGYDLRLYVNGALEGELNVQPHGDPSGPKTVAYGGHDVGIGRHPLFGTRNFDGLIDEPSFYARALSASEAAALYSAKQVGKCLDASPPIVAILAPLDGSVVGATSVLISGAVIDSSATTVTSTPAGINQALPPGGGSFAGTVPLATEGENIISVHAVDDPQNPPGGQSIRLIRDTTDPEIQILSPVEGAVYAASPIQAIVAVLDATRVDVTLGGVTQLVEPGGAAVAFSVDIVSGTNLLTVTAQDAAGRQIQATRSVVLDADRPLVAIEMPAEGTILGPGQSSTMVVATIEDLTTTFVSSEPTGLQSTLPPGGGSVSGLVALVEGYNLIKVTAVDSAGFPGTADRIVVFDSVPPTVAVVSPPANGLLRGVVDFDAEAADPLPGSGVGAVVFEVDGQAIGSFAAPPYGVDLDTTILADGPHVLSARATDGVGIPSQSAPVPVVVDNGRPDITFVGLADGNVVSGSLAFQIDLSDAVSGIASSHVTCNGVPPTVDPSATFAPTVGSASLTGVENTAQRPDGPLVIMCRVVDAAGNEATKTVSLVVQNAPAEYALTAPAAGDRVKGVVVASATTSDAAVLAITLSVDGVAVGSGPGPTFAAPYDSRLRLDGAAEFKATFTRAVGPAIERSVVVHINNLTVEVRPQTLNVRRRDQQQHGRVTATIEGLNAALLLPPSISEIELRVPGGSPVLPLQAWPANEAPIDHDGDGIPELRVPFERRQVVAAIRAGIASGKIQPDDGVAVAIYARLPNGTKVLIGRDRMRIAGAD